MHKQLFQDSKLRLAVAVRVCGTPRGERIANRNNAIQLWGRDRGDAFRTTILEFFRQGRDSTAVLPHAANAQWLCYALQNYDMHFLRQQNRKVAGSIPDGVIGIFHWDNSSDRTMILGSTQPLTELSTRRIYWG